MVKKEQKNNHIIDEKNWNYCLERFAKLCKLFAKEMGLEPSEAELMLYALLQSHQISNMMVVTGLKPVEPSSANKYTG